MLVIEMAVLLMHEDHAMFLVYLDMAKELADFSALLSLSGFSGFSICEGGWRGLCILHLTASASQIEGPLRVLQPSANSLICEMADIS